jgi:arsenate reductase
MAKLALARQFNIGSDDLFPKTLDRYIGQHFDYVITVCDHAAESCPVFPGGPARLHWSFPDPAAVDGSEGEQQRAFDRIALDIAGHLRRWLASSKIAVRLSAR